MRAQNATFPYLLFYDTQGTLFRKVLIPVTDDTPIDRELFERTYPVTSLRVTITYLAS